MTLYKVVITQDLSIAASVLLALLWYKQDACLNQKALSRSLHCTDRSIRNYLRELIDGGFIASMPNGKNGVFIIYKKWFLKKTYDLYDTEKQRKAREKKLQERGDDLTSLFKSVMYGKK